MFQIYVFAQNSCKKYNFYVLSLKLETNCARISYHGWKRYQPAKGERLGSRGKPTSKDKGSRWSFVIAFLYFYLGIYETVFSI